MSYVPAGEKLLDFGGHSIAGADVIAVSPARDKNQTSKRRGGKLGGKRKNLDGGSEGAVDTTAAEEKALKKQNKREQRDRAIQEGKARRRAVPAFGMTMEQADSVPGVGGLGISKPAWQ